MTNKPSKTTRAAEPAAKPAAPDEAAETVAAPSPEVAPSPDEEMKRKFREAMERKNPASGSEKTTHGDKGPAGHASAGSPTQRMFRRKAGG